MMQAPLPLVVILPVKVVVEVIWPDAQPDAKLLKLKSMARQNKKYWGNLNSFLIKRIPCKQVLEKNSLTGMMRIGLKS
jgi:hypothetical protein